MSADRHASVNRVAGVSEPMRAYMRGEITASEYLIRIRALVTERVRKERTR